MDLRKYLKENFSNVLGKINLKNTAIMFSTLGILGSSIPVMAGGNYHCDSKNSIYNSTKKFDKNGARIRGGLEIITNEDIGLKGGVDWSIKNKSRIGPYAKINFSNQYSQEEKQNLINENETKLIGPGTYKHSLKEIDLINQTKDLGEIGIENQTRFWKDFGTVLNIGGAFQKTLKSQIGRKTISYERNKESLGEDVTISNTIQDTETNFVPTISAGVIYDLRDNMSLSILGQKTEGKEVTGILGVEFLF